MNASTTENNQPRIEMTTCPSDRQLGDYLCGHLSSAELHALDEHLPTCSDCAARLRKAEQENERLVEALRDTTCEDSNPLGQHAAEAAALKAALALQLPTASEQSLSSVGAYELLESIGSGGMGNVYLARHKSLNKRVAIKLLPLRWTPHRDDLMRRFEREIRAAGALEHPAIVAAHDAGMDAQVHYLVMDFVDGVDLAQVARAVDRLEIADAAAIGLQVAQGLAYAHAKGMVHRDVKPSNIMLDKSGQVRILDFGLVLMDPWEESAGELTTVGQFLGTLDYMAPEQAERSGAVDYRADLYALGATLFRLLTGRAPLATAPNLSPLEKLRLLANHNPPSLRSLRPDAPALLIAVVDQLLMTSPQDRPPSATAVAEVLASLSATADLKALIQQVSRQGNVAERADVLPMPRLPRNPTSMRSHGKWWHSWRKAIAVAMLPLSLLAGIGITLVTDRGTLVIESDDPDVQLEIVRDGHRAPVKDFQLRQDGEQLVLSSGEYEIRLKNATGDRLSLDRNRVLITRGDREVVRITRQLDEASIDNRERTSLYKGRSFSDWMNVLEQERSIEGAWDAIMGLITLATPDQQRFVAQASLVATRQYGSFFATEYFMQPGGFQANVSDSEGFMGKLKQHYWSLDTNAALAALLDELLTKHPRSTQACVALLSNLERSRLSEHADLVKQIRGVLTQLDFLEVARAMEGADQAPIGMFVDQARALVFNEVLRLTRVLDEPIASVPALADWFTEYLSQTQVQNSLDSDWLRATIELDLLDKVPVTVLAQTILGSNPRIVPEMAKDVEQIILRSREQGRDEQLAVALEQQILQVHHFGGPPATVYVPPIAPLADLLVQSASDRTSLANFLEARLNSVHQAREQGIVLDRFGGRGTAPKIAEEQEAFLKALIQRLREEQ